jgi:hypothetical protein
MADVIQPATSGRSKCRGCGHNIANGELRFGETVPNPYAEGETQHWFHLRCAACMRPEKALPAIESSEREVPDREWLVATATHGVAQRRLPRLLHAERSKSGKARCRSCRETIPAGVMRLSLQMFEEGRASPIGFIHVECALAYFGTADIFDRAERLSPDLDDAAKKDLAAQLGHQREPTPEEAASRDATRGDAAPADAATMVAEPPVPTGPDVAKARPVDDGEAKHAQSS